MTSVLSRTFNYNAHPVRTIVREGEPWFVAKDICAILEIENSRDALNRLDEDEKGVASTDTLRGKQQLAYVNEAGLYTLVLSSRKPEAKAFKRWVTHEVLPSIRRTGQYSAPKAKATKTVIPQQPNIEPKDSVLLILEVLTDLRKEQIDLSERVSKLEKQRSSRARLTGPVWAQVVRVDGREALTFRGAREHLGLDVGAMNNLLRNGAVDYAWELGKRYVFIDSLRAHMLERSRSSRQSALQLNETKALLRRVLTGNPVHADEVRTASKIIGVSRATLQRACSPP